MAVRRECKWEHANAQQIETGFAVHLSLLQFEPMNLALDGSVAPGVLDTSAA